MKVLDLSAVKKSFCGIWHKKNYIAPTNGKNNKEKVL